MEHFDWQTAVALIIVSLAAALVTRRMILWTDGRSHGCVDCPSRNSGSTLVSLDSVKLSSSLTVRRTSKSVEVTTDQDVHRTSDKCASAARVRGSNVRV